jgi:hypothetical protein
MKNMRSSIEKMRQAPTGIVETLCGMFTEATDMRETADQIRIGSGEIQKESGAIHKVVENLKSVFGMV